MLGYGRPSNQYQTVRSSCSTKHFGSLPVGSIASFQRALVDSTLPLCVVSVCLDVPISFRQHRMTPNDLPGTLSERRVGETSMLACPACLPKKLEAHEHGFCRSALTDGSSQPCMAGKRAPCRNPVSGSTVATGPELRRARRGIERGRGVASIVISVIRRVDGAADASCRASVQMRRRKVSAHTGPQRD